MEKRLTTKQAAEHLCEIGVQTTAGTLEVWRCYGRGPLFYRVGRRVFYTESDLEAWARGERVETTDTFDRVVA